MALSAAPDVLGDLVAVGTSRFWFLLLVVAVGIERLFEIWLSRRNARRVMARGGVEVGGEHYRWMALLHTGFLVAAVAEVVLLDRPFRPLPAALCLAVLGATMALRYWAVTTLGDRWNTRVICEPGAPRIATGPYRFLRHPNYLAVRVELLALPLVHGAYLTAILFSLLNAWMLRVRIAVEDRALDEYGALDDQGTADGTRVPDELGRGSLV